MKKPTSIVIPFIEGPENSLELRYALRSIDKNLSKKDVQIFLIGDKPDWVKNVTYIPIERVSGMDYMSFMDTANKIKLACEHPEIGSGFIYMHDDTFFIQRTTLPELYQVKAWEDTSKIDKLFQNTTASRKWCNVFEKTMKALKEKGLPIYNYETHTPRYFNIKKMKDLFEEFAPQAEPFQISTLYFNHFYEKEPRILQPWGDNFRLGIYKSFSVEQLKNKTRKNNILNIGKNMIQDKDMQIFLKYLFPEISKYEQQ